MGNWKEIFREGQNISERTSQAIIAREGVNMGSMFPLYVNSNLHLIAEELMENNHASNLVDVVRKFQDMTNKSMTLEDLSFELSILYLQQDRMSDAEFWYDQSVSNLLNDWGTIDLFNI